MHACTDLTCSTIPSRADSSVGWRSRSRCMIRLHLHSDAGALIVAPSVVNEGTEEVGVMGLLSVVGVV